VTLAETLAPKSTCLQVGADLFDEKMMVVAGEGGAFALRTGLSARAPSRRKSRMRFKYQRKIITGILDQRNNG